MQLIEVEAVRVLYISTIVFIFLMTGSLSDVAQAQRDEEIIERLIKIETQMTAMNVRIDAVNTRIDDLRSNMKWNIVDFRDLAFIILGGVMSLICGLLAMMGFVMWDRRTAITPVVKKL